MENFLFRDWTGRERASESLDEICVEYRDFRHFYQTWRPEIGAENRGSAVLFAVACGTIENIVHLRTARDAALLICRARRLASAV